MRLRTLSSAEIGIVGPARKRPFGANIRPEIAEDTRQATRFDLDSDREAAFEVERKVHGRLPARRGPPADFTDQAFSKQPVHEGRHHLRRQTRPGSDLCAGRHPHTPEHVDDHAALVAAAIKGSETRDAHTRVSSALRGWSIGFR